MLLPTFGDRGSRVVSVKDPYSRSRSSSVFLRKSGSPGNRTLGLWICNQELWPLDHRGDHGNTWNLNLSGTVQRNIFTWNFLYANRWNLIAGTAIAWLFTAQVTSREKPYDLCTAYGRSTVRILAGTTDVPKIFMDFLSPSWKNIHQLHPDFSKKPWECIHSFT
jgi:hypothetical protein